MKNTLFFVVSLFLISKANAQTITLTSPLIDSEVVEGDDYATQVLGNPWDFNERRDIGWEENFLGTSVLASGGIWSGKNNGSASYVFPLFPSFANSSVYTSGIEGDRTLPKFGSMYPIDSSKYNLLSYMGWHSAKQDAYVYWKTDPTGGNPHGSSPEEFWPNGTQLCWKRNELFNFHNQMTSGWQMQTFDLSNLVGDCGGSAGAWSGDIIALRIDASPLEPSGAITKFDWIRLVDPTSAPDITFTWTDSGISGSQFISVFVDNNNSGFDGKELAVVSGNPGTVSVPTAILPPGDWYFYLVVRDDSSPWTVRATSSYSGKLAVNKAPLVTFVSPTQVTGEDYATREINNPWDFSSYEDIANINSTVAPYFDYSWQQFSNYPPEPSGVFLAQAGVPLPGNTETDAQVHLNLGNSQADTGGVDSGAYRYLAFDLWIDPTLYPTISDKIQNGFVTRIVGWNALTNFDQRFAPKHNIIYEDTHRYYLDLHNPDIAEKGVFPTTKAWLEKEIWSHLRLDPQETGFEGPTWFRLDNVGLYTENFSKNQEFEIAWDIEDDDTSLDISIYYDDDNSGFDGTLIASLTGQSAGAGSYNWDTSALSEGNRYYIYLIVDDGVNVSRFYSPVEIIIGPPANETSQILASPLYSLWNSFLDMTNILELVNKGESSLSVDLTFYRIDGSVWHTMTVNLGATGQFDVILNDLPNFPSTSYGVVKMEFSGDKLDGRMSFYRNNTSGTPSGDAFEFVFNEPFLNPIKGTSYVSFNTYQPSLNSADANNPVLNWLSVVNLHPTVAKSFTVNRYNIAGGLVSTRRLENVPAFSRVDIDGGHGDGANLVGYNEIIPDDASSPYKGLLARYGLSDPLGFGYDFAFILKAVTERPSVQWVNASIADGAQNWLEVINTSNSSVTAQVSVFDYSGNLVHDTVYPLSPKAQQHIEIGSLLNSARPYGAVRILASKNNAIVAQNMFYARESSGSVRAMYGYHADKLRNGEQSSSWNLFLGMDNDLHFFNASSKAKTVRLMIGNGSKVKERTYDLPGYTGQAVELSENLEFGTISDFYGTVRVHGSSLVANSVRKRNDSQANFDYITPVDVRP